MRNIHAGTAYQWGRGSYRYGCSQRDLHHIPETCLSVLGGHRFTGHHGVGNGESLARTPISAIAFHGSFFR